MARFLFGSKATWRVAVSLVGSVAVLTLLACRPSPPDSSPKTPRANPFAIGSVPGSESPPTDRPSESQSCPIQLHDVSDSTGITFTHSDGSSGLRYVVEAMSTGIATFDYDGDGLIDIYFPNGAPLLGWQAEELPRHALYRNLGDWKFQDVSQQAGIVCTAYGMGVTVGDYDDDGYPDLYLSNFGPNILYHNNGDGTFSDVTVALGVGREEFSDTIGAGVSFLDMEGDGDLDLYVGNYIRLNCLAHTPHSSNGFPSYPSPREYEPIPDTLYRNDGQRFTDVSDASGVALHAGRGMGVTSADIDNDGDSDVFICNDVMENFLMVNDGNGFFQESALTAGTALNSQGEMVANMAVDSTDFDHDGWLDFYTTNYQGQLPLLFRNIGQGMFEEIASATEANAGCYPYVNWGCGFVDFDNDGNKDLFIANGHTEDNMDERDRDIRYRCPNFVLHNLGNGTFVNVSETAGDGLAPVEASRGTAFDDLDNDGDLDVVVLNSRVRPSILRNMLQESASAQHWLEIRLRGRTINRDGVGSHVVVVTGPLRQLDEVHSGRGYQSHWGTQLHFGLGQHDHVDSVEVHWHGAAAEVFENVGVDRVVNLVQGTGRPLPDSPQADP